MLKNIRILLGTKIFALILVILIISYSIMGLFNVSNAASTYNQSVKSGISAFPAEYQTYLKEIQQEHPNWTFDAYYTGIDWNELITNETVHGRNRIINTANSLWKCSCGNVATGYACASPAIIKYYIDPRNFLNSDVKLFQFLEISYNEKIHTIQGITNSIKGTFMENKKVRVTVNGQTRDMSYEEIILEAAKQSKMSPYSIVTKIIQEVGSKGSGSVTGTYPGYEGYYNFYNYAASDGGSPIEKGLNYAKYGKAGQSQADKNNLMLPWNNQYKAIIGGAKLIANSYTNAGQNTAYFYKWDVVGTKILQAGQSQQVSSSNCFWHQYMANIQDPTSQTSKLYNTYVNSHVIDSKLNFVIPVYNNMPKTNKLPTNLTKNDGNLYYMTGTAVKVRNAPTTSGKVLATMNTLDEIVAVLERKCANANGHNWDKVKISSGTVGYIASEYLSPCEEAKVAKIEGNNIKAVPNNNVSAIANELGITSYELVSNGVKKADANKVGTGDKLKDKKTGKQYTVIVLGDIDGDGKVLAKDALVILKQSTKAGNLKDVYLKAADTNGDGKVLASDALQTLKNSTGDQNISV